MTKANAIKILQEYIAYKENSLRVWNESPFKTDLEKIRQGLANLTQRDKDVLEDILSELKPKK